jgi:hypothetical protein
MPEMSTSVSDTAGLTPRQAGSTSGTTATLTADVTVIHTGRRTAAPEGKVLDAQGKLIAHATTTCMVLQVASRGRLHLA